jgi:hypothetical protein
MAVLPVEAAQLEVSCHIPPCDYHLLFYGSDEFVVPGWWIGVEDSNGDLQQTSFLPSAGVSPYDVLIWLQPITGKRVAAELVDRAKLAVASIPKLRSGLLD